MKKIIRKKKNEDMEENTNNVSRSQRPLVTLLNTFGGLTCINHYYRLKKEWRLHAIQFLDEHVRSLEDITVTLT